MTDIWSTALRRLSTKIAPQNYDMWLRPIECRGIDGRTITLRAPNQYVRLWFESNYLSVVLDELRTETTSEYLVEFEPDTEPVQPPPPSISSQRTSTPTAASDPSMHPTTLAEPTPESNGFADFTAHDAHGDMLGSLATGTGAELAIDSIEPFEPPPVPGERAGGDVPHPLNPKYTFDTFVAGPSNQLAYAASQAASSTYPPKYNPVFICGGVGLGKTHLLHSIGHTFRKNRPGARILYISGERFMNEYIHAIRTNRMHDFRNRYRKGCDVLLVDDVQFLAGKDGTQDEFFHTFNALHDAHRQIVLTADRKPFEISDIADRLRTRFAWGLLADIEPPELEVRVAILRKKAAAESIFLPDDVALYIAAAVKSNVRELEGALIRLAAYASLSNREINLDFARETLEGSITRPREHLTADAVLKAVAHYYGLKVADLKSARRHKSIAGPRAVAMYLARTHTKDSYPDLGRAFGGKHHTTVISAVEKITKKQKNDPALRGELHAIESVLLR
ncbi:MAG TPA: chromosomal replication initiator protein DnaA [Kofleriaceae bacterium]|nr:chromosomal replication initiator protein DnaA [Kofleriaceae bacterium]